MEGKPDTHRCVHPGVDGAVVTGDEDGNHVLTFLLHAYTLKGGP